jgi:hypothetical protein
MRTDGQTKERKVRHDEADNAPNKEMHFRVYCIET